jgi:hypothetical protein
MRTHHSSFPFKIAFLLRSFYCIIASGIRQIAAPKANSSSAHRPFSLRLLAFGSAGARAKAVSQNGCQRSITAFLKSIYQRIIPMEQRVILQ